MTQATAIKKISAATIIGDVKKMVAKGELQNGSTLYRAIGIVDSFREGVSTYGEWVGFLGDFEIVNCLTGERFTAPQFFGDRSFSDALKAKLTHSDGQPVEFALEVSIEVNDKYPTGYCYVTRPIMQNSVSRLQLLRERMAELPQIAAPVTPIKKKA